MEQDTPEIFWDKLKEARASVQESIKVIGEAILFQYELQEATPYSAKESDFKIVTQVPLQPLAEIIHNKEDVEVLISKINHLSNTHIMGLTTLGLTEENLEKNFYLSIYRPELLRKIVDYLNSRGKVATQNDVSNLVQKIEVGPLVYDTNGGIYFNGKIIKLRKQLKDLCVLLMKNHGEPTDYSIIKDTLIDARKRNLTKFNTITKYVAELHKVLRKHFKRNVIFNHTEESYIFDINRNS